MHRASAIVAGLIAHTGLVAGALAQADPHPEWTLFSPLGQMTTYLIDLDGNVVHTWLSAFPTGHAVYLLDDGKILRSCRDDSNGGPNGGGTGGRLQRIAWDGTLEWSYLLADSSRRHHHDALPMPNGNVLAIVWEVKTQAEAIAAGRNPAIAPTEVWSERILELEPVGTDDANIVWEWCAFDHLVQNFDSNLPNFGQPSDHPERIDINFGGTNSDWLHFNGLDYNADLDQIILSSNFFDEIWIISHAPGASGDLLYRWGNPRAYGMGTLSDQQLFNQHHPQWIEPGLPGAGNILVYNNGNDRPGGPFSTVDEIVPPVDGSGGYTRTPGQPFGPAAPAWTCDNIGGSPFYSFFISGAQRLANGHTLICVGNQGHFFEVEADCELVWDYDNPFGQNAFRAERIDARDPRLEGLLWCAADHNGDGIVNTQDVLAFLNDYAAQDPVADFNDDGLFNTQDLLAFLNEWNAGC